MSWGLRQMVEELQQQLAEKQREIDELHRWVKVYAPTIEAYERVLKRIHDRSDK